MEMTLRKARKLEAKILNHRVEKVDTSMSLLRATEISASSMQEVLDETNKASIEALNVETKLVEVRYRIRESVSFANGSFGLSKLMNELSRLQAESGLIRRLVQSFQKTEPSELIHYAKKRDASESMGFGGMDAVGIPAFSDNVEFKKLEARAFDIKERIEEIEDKLMELNSSKKVTLAEEDISFLRELKIVR